MPLTPRAQYKYRCVYISRWKYCQILPPRNPHPVHNRLERLASRDQAEAFCKINNWLEYKD